MSCQNGKDHDVEKLTPAQAKPFLDLAQSWQGISVVLRSGAARPTTRYERGCGEILERLTLRNTVRASEESDGATKRQAELAELRDTIRELKEDLLFEATVEAVHRIKPYVPIEEIREVGWILRKVREEERRRTVSMPEEVIMADEDSQRRWWLGYLAGLGEAARVLEGDAVSGLVEEVSQARAVLESFKAQVKEG